MTTYQETFLNVAGKSLVVNGDRLNQRLYELAEVGQLPNGGVDDPLSLV